MPTLRLRDGSPGRARTLTSTIPRKVIDEDRVSYSTRTLEDDTEAEQMDEEWIEESLNKDVTEDNLGVNDDMTN